MSLRREWGVPLLTTLVSSVGDYRLMACVDKGLAFIGQSFLSEVYDQPHEQGSGKHFWREGSLLWPPAGPVLGILEHIPYVNLDFW